MSQKAAGIQVHSQMSTLLSNCKNLGPVTASHNDLMMMPATVVAQARIKAREQVADKGGDTLAVTNVDQFSDYEAAVQGVALKCY